jgi:hypothetical protein
VLSFFFELGASCIRPVYYGLRPFAPFEYTYKKKKHIYFEKTHACFSCLSNLPTYIMSLFPPPAGVANCIEKLQRDFLWAWCW